MSDETISIELTAEQVKILQELVADELFELNTNWEVRHLKEYKHDLKNMLAAVATAQVLKELTTKDK